MFYQCVEFVCKKKQWAEVEIITAHKKQSQQYNILKVLRLYIYQKKIQ